MLEKMRENASGWVVKVLFGIIIAVFILAFGGGGLQTGGDPIFATVDDEIISVAEFEEAFQRNADTLRRTNPNISTAQLQSPQFKQMVYSDLVNTRLLLTEADRLGVTASDEEVFAGITRLSFFWNEQGQFDREIYLAALRSLRMTPGQFEANFKKEMIADKVMEIVRSAGAATPEQARSIYDWVREQAVVDFIRVNPQAFMDAVEVTPAEVEQRYADNQDRYMTPEQVRVRYLNFTPDDLAAFQDVSEEEIMAFYEANAAAMRQQEEVKARHILILVKEDDPEDVQAEAKAKIDRVHAMAAKGEDFAELARQHSEGPSSVTGGDLGWFGRGDMVPEFETAAFATAKGDVSEPVKTQFGWHVVFVEDRKEAKEKTLDEVRDDIAGRLAREKAAGQLNELLDQAMDRLASGMTIEALADELGLLAVTSRPVAQQLLPQAFGLTPEAAETVMNLPMGSVNPTPLAIDGGYMLVEKVEDIDSAPIELAVVQDSIITEIQRQKALELATAEAETILAAVIADRAVAEKTYADRIETSQPFDRNGALPGLGQNPTLAADVFQAEDDSWLNQPYNLQSGILIVRKREVIPASDAEWAEQKDAWIAQASQNYQQEILGAFLNELRSTAQITLARPDLLN